MATQVNAPPSPSMESYPQGFDAITNRMDQIFRAASPSPLVRVYDSLLENQSPLVKDMPLTHPFWLVFISLGYLVVVYLGKWFMKDRKRVELGRFPIFHNAFLISLSTYMVIEMIRQAFLADYGFWCNKVDNSPSGLGMARIMWVYYVSKVIEYGDTFIMILRKNFAQISFLHVYHHFSIFVVWWFMINYAPNGDVLFSSVQNSFVHVIMYSYYLASYIAGPELKRWLNRYKYWITYIQLTQFFLNAFQVTYSLANGCDQFPVNIRYLFIAYMASMIILFTDVLIKAKKRAASPIAPAALSPNNIGGSIPDLKKNE